ncbi:MAG: hypothetical protein E6G60_16790 [Actinobacteria bacterium]|nr:MAG: hypothetical protein E6G60_16790 [Actinomycetota bacterium]
MSGGKDESLAFRVGTSNAPRGAEIVIEGVGRPVLGEGRGRVGAAAVLFDDGARRVARAGKDVEPVARRRGAPHEIDGKPNRLRNLDVSDPDFRETDGVRKPQRKRRPVGLQDLDFEAPDRARGKVHDGAFGAERIGAEGHGLRRAVIEMQASLGDVAVTNPRRIG